MLKKLLNRILPTPPAVPEGSSATQSVSAAASAREAAIAPASAPLPSAVPGDVVRADTLIEEGNALEDGGESERAERLYRDAVEAAPGHARAHLNLGIVLAARGETKDALAAFEQVLTIDPKHPFGSYNLARLAFVDGDLERAQSLLATALAGKPEFPQALIVQASVLDALGKTEIGRAHV